MRLVAEGLQRQAQLPRNVLTPSFTTSLTVATTLGQKSHRFPIVPAYDDGAPSTMRPLDVQAQSTLR
jgi:hypothetical protein